MFHVFYDLLDIILNISHWIRTARQSKLITSSWSYYFEFIVFVVLSYIFPCVINTQVLKNNILFQLLKSYLCNKLRTTIFYIQEYCFHVYIRTIIDKSCFFYCILWLKFIVFYDRISFMLQTVHDVSRSVKMGSFWFCYYYKLVVFSMHSHYYYGLIKIMTWRKRFLMILGCW